MERQLVASKRRAHLTPTSGNHLPCALTARQSMAGRRAPPPGIALGYGADLLRKTRYTRRRHSLAAAVRNVPHVSSDLHLCAGEKDA